MSKEASLRWYNKNKARLATRRKQRGKLGLCKYCGKKALKELSGCRPCLDKFAAQRRKKWKKRVADKPRLKWDLINSKGGKCMDCGYKKHHAALEFDHVKGRKLNAVANLINAMVTWKRVLKEVDKCELVCANCHAIRTYERLH